MHFACMLKEKEPIGLNMVVMDEGAELEVYFADLGFEVAETLKVDALKE